MKPLLAVKALVSLALLAWIVSRADLANVMAALSSADPAWIAACLVMPFVAAAIVAYRWRMLLRELQVDLRFGVVYRSCVVAMFFRQFLPSTVGGDVARAYDAWRAGASRTATVMSLFVDRLLGLLALILLAVAALLFGGPAVLEYPELRWWIIGVAGTLLVTTWMAFVPRSPLPRALRWAFARLPGSVAGLGEDVMRATTVYSGKTSGVAKGMAISIVMQLQVVLFYYMCGAALGLDLEFTSLLFVVPAALVVMLLPVSINGIGLREGVFALLLAPLGVEAADAIAFAWVDYGTNLSGALIGGLVYALRRGGLGTRGKEPTEVADAERAAKHPAG